VTRLVSWNLNHWLQKRGERPRPDAAWAHLGEQLQADVALLQRSSTGGSGTEAVVGNSTSDHGGTGEPASSI
jgi:hypothetical protein